jgi:hypothetical protein
MVIAKSTRCTRSAHASGFLIPRNLSAKEFAVDDSSLECARCGVHLPLKRDLAADDPEAAWVCANCGWQMPGLHDPTARDTIQANVTPAPPGVEIRRRDRRRSEPLLQRFLLNYLLSSGCRT